MPIYRYICPTCKIACDAYRTIDTRDHAPIHCDGAMVRKIMPTMVRVFQGYQAVAVDKETGEAPFIRTLGEHEAFLKRNGYNEVGNDKSMMAPTPEDEAHRRATAPREPEVPVYSEADLIREGWIAEDL